jgi:hypothetical protein
MLSEGQRFGSRVLITEDYGGDWLVLCDCGDLSFVSGSKLLHGKGYSCKSCSVGAYVHGHSVGGKESPTYKSWSGMIYRCTNPSYYQYDEYGGRGIRVCDRWLIFENFLEDMGVRPKDTTLDRLDNDGNYEPGNCRWATAKEQALNRKTTRWYIYSGVTMCLKDWSEFFGIKYLTLYMRIKRGWSFENAILGNRRATCK